MAGPWSRQARIYRIDRPLAMQIPLEAEFAVEASPRPTVVFIYFYTDIQLKTLSRRIEVFNMKINMRRDSVIFHLENNRIDNAVRRCLSN